MTDTHKITLSKSKVEELNFDLSIKGVDKDQQISVRFIIWDKKGPYNMIFVCTNKAETTWTVKLPRLDMLSSDRKYTYEIEIITDGYHFVAASGKLELLAVEQVKVSEVKAQKEIGVTVNSVTVAPTIVEDASFGVSGAEGDATEEDEEESPLEAEEETDVTQEPVSEIAHPQLPRFMRGVEKPSTTGSLFKRSGDGKPLVTGLTDSRIKTIQAQNDAKVKQIIDSTQ